MSQDKPDRDLITLLNHARERADWRPSEKRSWLCKPTRGEWIDGKWQTAPANHPQCRAVNCGCDCHCPTDADRELWVKIATEIDGYLAGPGDQEALI